MRSTCGNSNDSSVRCISRVSRNLANPRDDSQDALTGFFVCFPHFFTHIIKAHIIHEILRRVSERKPQKYIGDLEIAYLQFSMHFSQFSSLSSLSSFISFERSLAQRKITPILSVVSCYGAFGKHWVMSFYGG